MRLVVGLALVAEGCTSLWGSLPVGTVTISAALATAGLFLALGLWTPVLGTAVALIEIGQTLASAGSPQVHLLQAAMGAALAMLGPGLWSIDARLFGWRRVEVQQRKPRQG
jgi:hypothetical protein